MDVSGKRMQITKKKVKVASCYSYSSVFVLSVNKLDHPHLTNMMLNNLVNQCFQLRMESKLMFHRRS